MKYPTVFIRYTSSLVFVALLFLPQQQSSAAGKCPCDILADGATPCVAAHSTTRALYASYNGPLYQVRRTSDNKLQDIPLLSQGGVANASVQDSFLAGKAGTISKIYDQSPNGNHLKKAGAGGFLHNGGLEANATAAKINLNGHPVYGVYTTSSWDNEVGSVGYRNDTTKSVITGNNAEGVYMVCSGKHYNSLCCFDYGNAQTNRVAKGPATMESIYFGNSTQWGHGSGAGPWVMNDCEFGIQAGVDANLAYGVYNGNTTINADYVTGIVKSDTSNLWAIRAGDAVKDTLKTMYRGRQRPGYYPKLLEGSIILGVGGDNSHTGEGTFFEGVMTKGMPADSTDNAVQKNIIAAGYGSQKTSAGPGADFGGKDASSMFKSGFNPSTFAAMLEYALTDARSVGITVFDQQGRRVAVIVNGVVGAGRHRAVWDARGVPSGVYVWKAAIDGRKEWAGKIVVGK